MELLVIFLILSLMKKGNRQLNQKFRIIPLLFLKCITPDKPEGEVSFVAIRQTIEPNGENQYKMSFKSVETKNVSALTVRKDLTLWVIALGGAIFMIGVIQGAYWNHRRIWIKRE